MNPICCPVAKFHLKEEKITEKSAATRHLQTHATEKKRPGQVTENGLYAGQDFWNTPPACHQGNPAERTFRQTGIKKGVLT
jgi:hypothetical protein